MGQDKFGQATYNLCELQALLRDPATRRVTTKAEINASSVGIIGKEEIVARVLQLRPDEIYKTMTANLKPGLWQDVYKTQEAGIPLYIKLQKSYDEKGVVIQLKKDTS
ncbi:MAG: hypothetical protein GY737_11855 [Desulfobacteraceae bacterium]|nr:hypothetical protein [Desulfobacteraceae bacterium]